jgi:hypothetical protein
MIINAWSFAFTGSIRPNGAMFIDGDNFICVYITWLRMKERSVKDVKGNGCDLR